VTLNTGAGNDAVNVGNPAGNLDDLQGALAVNGQGGTNAQTVNDQTTGGSRTYTLTATSLARGGAAPITFSGLNTLKVYGSWSGGNVFTVNGAPATTTVTLNGNGLSTALLGPNAATTWTITGADAGSLGGKLSFTDMQTLEGGIGNDTFKFLPGGSISGFIVGGGGTNKLDYTQAGTTPVVVDLAAASAPTSTGAPRAVSPASNPWPAIPRRATRCSAPTATRPGRYPPQAAARPGE
jgi:hypothetical protein